VGNVDQTTGLNHLRLSLFDTIVPVHALLVSDSVYDGVGGVFDYRREQILAIWTWSWTFQTSSIGELSDLQPLGVIQASSRPWL
jgi:hypothetical protein